VVVTAPILTIDPLHPQPRHIERCTAILEAGGLIAYPTDTYYGVGCDLFNKKAIERIYQLKQRPKTKPLSFICPDLSDLSRYAQVSNAAFATMRRLTPGPYTFVLEATSTVPKIAVTRQKTVGIRVPDSPIALALVRALGRPLVSTSASTPDGTVLIDPSDIQDLLGHGLELVIDGGYQLDEPSTVLDLTGDEPVVLRMGKGDVTGVA
jgi:tRNA threonylcarbamoyl adenosine modification protein (Sua5/YciO/YrdC/YwlC family)